MSWRTASKVKWLASLPGVSEQEPLASRTSFGIGGPADFFVELCRPQASEELIRGCAERRIPYHLLWAGTNLMVPDEGATAPVCRVVTSETHGVSTLIPQDAGPRVESPLRNT